jgi:hypothetical protein
MSLMPSRHYQEAHSAMTPLSPNKSLLRSGGRWYLVCKSLAGIDKVPMIILGEPPAAELGRWATGRCANL